MSRLTVELLNPNFCMEKLWNDWYSSSLGEEQEQINKMGMRESRVKLFIFQKLIFYLLSKLQDAFLTS